MKFTKIPQRAWINQPSKLQPDHALHGTRVLAIDDTPRCARVFFVDSLVESQQIPKEALSPGWPAHLCFSWYKAAYDRLIAQLDHDWPPPTHSTVAKETDLMIGHIRVCLKPDGTYNLGDESGG